MNKLIIEDRKVLGRKIASIKGRGKRLDADIHQSAVSCLYHAQQHGDTTLLARLCGAMPRSARGKALCTWAEAFAPLTIDRKKFTVKLAKDRTPEQFRIDDAAATPFWDYTQEADPTPLTLEKFVAMLQRIAEGNTEKSPADDATKQAALKAIKAIKGKKAAEAVEAGEAGEELTEQAA